MGILTEMELVSKYTALRSMLRADVCWDQGYCIAFFGKRKDDTCIREGLWSRSVSSIKRKGSNRDYGASADRRSMTRDGSISGIAS